MLLPIGLGQPLAQADPAAGDQALVALRQDPAAVGCSAELDLNQVRFYVNKAEKPVVQVVR